MTKNDSQAYLLRLREVADRLGTRREAAEHAGVSLDAIIRYLRGENQPSFQAISRLCQAAGISAQWLASGEGPMEIDAVIPASSAHSLPLNGFAEKKTDGWYTPQAMTSHVSLEIADPNAFAVTVHGQGLMPEGLQPGFLCICSPMLRPVKGDIVHIKRQDGMEALKIFTDEDGSWLVLKSYTDQDAQGRQRAFEDRIKKGAVSQLAPVVFIRRKF